MKYSVKYRAEALRHLKKLEKSGRKADMARALRFIEEVKAHPRSGTGKPEHMRHQKEGERYGRGGSTARTGSCTTYPRGKRRSSSRRCWAITMTGRPGRRQMANYWGSRPGRPGR